VDAVKVYSLLLLSLAIVACAPPYSAELNSSAPLAAQMTVLGDLGPMKSPDGSSTTAAKFLPLRPTAATISGLDVQSGFLVSQSSGRENLCFVYNDSDGKMQTSSFRQSFPLAGANSNYPLYEYDVISSTATVGTILVFRLDGTSSSSSLQLFTADLTTGQLSGAATNPDYLTSIYGSQLPLAVQYVPLLAAPLDKYDFLFSNGSGTGAEVDASLSGTAFGTGVILRSVTIPSGIKRMLYYRTADDTTSYFGRVSGGAWTWSRWDGSSMVSLPEVTHRIDALLSNGELISTEDGTLRVYDSGGSELSSVGMGAMQFCYEAYIGSTPYVFFSVAFDFPREAWMFRTYAVKTSELKSLKG
jgi:hypothetical protein